MTQIQNNTQKRWLSAPLWTALGAQLLSLLVIVGVIDVGQSDVLKALIIAVCETLTAFGVLNNPTSKNSF